ncbi:hypothetical protein FUAX_01910 [Fulvitalea axinellae]|uniref:Lipoprotein n=1 Tax=Fulvitalea axinellae TaxID=1182444 RepID=A0AAU9D026_9BACT|nr:hypothetical protein FUAX_01910 [Fulvitalea axinellae]
MRIKRLLFTPKRKALLPVILGLVILLAGCSKETQPGQKTEKHHGLKPGAVPAQIQRDFHLAFPRAESYSWYGYPGTYGWQYNGLHSWGPWTGDYWDYDIWDNGLPPWNSFPTFYEVDFMQDGHSYQSFYSPTGLMILTRRFMDFDELPEAVQNAFEKGPYGHKKLKKKNIQEVIKPGYYTLYRLVIQRGLFKKTLFYTKEGFKTKPSQAFRGYGAPKRPNHDQP